MALQPVNIEALALLQDGKLKLAAEAHIRRVAMDCYDRPGDDKDRTVTIKLKFKPVMDSDGSCGLVASQFFVSSSIPDHRTKVMSFGLKPNGSLVFNEDSLENVDQATFLKDDDAA